MASLYLAHGKWMLSSSMARPRSPAIVDDQINPEIAGVTFMATGLCPIRHEAQRLNWMLSNPEIHSQHGYIRSMRRLQMSHAGGRQAWRGDSNWLLSNPEIEATLMHQAIPTLVVEHVVERAYAQALANSHRISRAFSLQPICQSRPACRRMVPLSF